MNFHNEPFAPTGIWNVRRDPTAEEQSARLWRMTAAERVAAMYAGNLSMHQCLEWAALAPDEIPKVNDEWWFIAVRTPEYLEADNAAAPTSPDSSG